MAVLSFHKTIKDRYNLGTQLLDFFNKLTDNPENPSLHVEPIAAAVDKRVRTARVTQKYRAVLFELNGTGERHFLLIDVLNHDEAYQLATKKRLMVNPVNGLTELKDVQPSGVGPDAMTQAEIESRAKQLAAEKAAQYKAKAEKEVAAAGADVPDGVGKKDDAKEIKQVGEIQPVPAEVLKAARISDVQLSDELGLSSEAIEILLTAPTVNAVEELLLTHPSWEHDAAVGLLAGMTIEEVREDLKLEVEKDEGSAADVSEDDALIAGMTTPAAQMDFAVAPNEEELATIIDEGSFNAWRVFLHPNQRKAVEAHHNGSARITGGAGTGKTVVVIHRTKYLLDQNPRARVLLTTFTRDLANALKNQMNVLDPTFPEASVHGAPGLWISGVDALVADVLKNAHKGELRSAFEDALGIQAAYLPRPLAGNDERRLWEESVELKGTDLTQEKAHPTFLAQEYSTVILTHGIKDEKSYLRVSRAGRGTPLSRKERKAVWATVALFQAKCAAAGYLTFAASAVVAASVVAARGNNAMFDHVLIDEAQDFHAGHWRFLRACAKNGPNDIFLAEDSHQRIYGQRLILSHYGIETRGRASTKLRVNYRTTAQNLGYATAILDGTEWVDSEEQIDDLHGYRSVRQGPAPLLLHSKSHNEEAQKLAAQIKHWLEPSAEGKVPEISVGILVRNNTSKNDIATLLGDLDVPVSAQRQHDPKRPVSVMTMHNAKGLEFTHVVLADVSADAVPQMFQLRGLAPAEREDSLQRERALLYVAASRARDVLLVSVVGEASELLPSE